MTQKPPAAVAIGKAFAFRAEQLKGQRIWDLYEQPGYFHELETEAPCMLIGGRGTGKTTVLRGLSYRGQSALRSDEPVETWPYYGVYMRFHTAQVGTFSGAGIPEERWQKLFAHYLNLALCQSVLEFVTWYQERTGTERLLPKDVLVAVAEHLNAFDQEPEDEAALLTLVGRLLRRFQAYVNGIADAPPFTPSTLGAPIDELLQALMDSPPMEDKLFFFLLDEFETLGPSHQEVVNTLVKHAGQHYTLKIGVKEHGWRRRTVIGSGERLQAQADYTPVDIRQRLDGAFPKFGERICNERLQAAAEELGVTARPLAELLPRLSEDEEAELLGITEHVERIRAGLVDDGATETELAEFDARPPLFRYLLALWASRHGDTTRHILQDSIAKPREWDVRYRNNKHALLFTIRRGKSGLRKHYAGLDTYTALAATNLRFMVQLVERALLDHEEQAGEGWNDTPVQPETQTRAAEHVARTNLIELEGLSLIGPRLTRLCAGLGRVFHLMAWDPIGHNPEVTQFWLSDIGADPYADELAVYPGGPDSGAEPIALLAEAISHLAILAFPSTRDKPGQPRGYDYMVHPIFAPLFVYSYRKIDKLALSSTDLTSLVKQPQATVLEILARVNRQPLQAEDRPLPDQMQLFDRYLVDVA